MKAILPAICLLLWSLLALSNVGGDFSSAVQARYYLWLPLAMACLSLALLLLHRAKPMKVAVQLLALLMLIALLPYMFYYTGGV